MVGFCNSILEGSGSGRTPGLMGRVLYFRRETTELFAEFEGDSAFPRWIRVDLFLAVQAADEGDQIRRFRAAHIRNRRHLIGAFGDGHLDLRVR
jgi:hypothetical protein